MTCKKYTIIALMLLTAFAAADTYDISTVDLNYSEGAAYTSTIIIDFGTDYCVISYSWDDSVNAGAGVTTFDALKAMDLASDDFLMDYTDFGWGIMVNDFSYTGLEKYDYLANGDQTNFYYWAYYTGDNAQWSESWDGVSGNYLSDGSFDSLVWTNCYGEYPNSLIRRPGQIPVCYQVVPEPAVIALLAFGSILIRKKL